MWLQFLHHFGLTNLSGDQVAKYELLKFKKQKIELKKCYGFFKSRYLKRKLKRSVLSLITRGIRLAENGFNTEAQHLFEEAIKLLPDFPEPRICLANIFLLYGRYSQAESQLKTALDLNPDKETKRDILNNIAWIYFAQKRYSRAIKEYEKIISLYGDDHIAYYNIGLSNEKLGLWDSALSYFNYSNSTLPNSKAQLGIKRVNEQKWCSPEIEKILNLYKKKCEKCKDKDEEKCEKCKKFDFKFPPYKDGSLALDELEKVKGFENDSLAFFVGAGISLMYPSCLPQAREILKHMFHFIFELDKREICEFFKMSFEIEETIAYRKIAHKLNNYQDLSFEPSFQALYDILEFPVITFVKCLSGGEPNLHHMMLAYALYKGHVIITTNFDTQIEKAFKKINKKYEDHFKKASKELKILVTDKDYQEAIENDHIDGILAKIHGDMDDYNSLALTSEGLSATCDRTIWVGDDIDQGLAKKQLLEISPKTVLSIPKALFLQRILKKKTIIVMGYSASDTFDIIPILNSTESEYPGLWVEHTCYPIKREIREWKKNCKRREILQPKTKEEEKGDISSKVSSLFFNLFVDNFAVEEWRKEQDEWRKDQDEKKNVNFKICYENWIERLRLRPGDGLNFLGKLYSQHGKWSQAEVFYSKAIEKYRRNSDYTESRWLVTMSNLGYIKEHLNEMDKALDIYKRILQYIENKQNQKLYEILYAKVLINIAGRWINTDKDSEGGRMIHKAIQIAQKTGDKEILCYGLRVTADRDLAQKNYKQALAGYMTVIQLSCDILGNIREACLAQMHAAICLANLDDRDSALRMIRGAEMYADHLKDNQLINTVRKNVSFILNRFIGQSPTQKLHEELIEAAKKQVDVLVSKQIDELNSLVGLGVYDRSLTLIDRLLKLYDHPDVKAELLFLKSNIYRRMERPIKEIKVLEEFCKIKPQNPLAEHNLGVAHLKLKDYVTGENHLREAIKRMNGNYPLAICNLGIAYVQMGKLKAAKEQLLKAEKLNSPKSTLNILRKRILELERNIRRKEAQYNGKN